MDVRTTNGGGCLNQGFRGAMDDDWLAEELVFSYP